MKKSILAAAVAASSVTAPLAQAEITEERFRALEESVRALQQTVKQQNVELQQRDEVIADLRERVDQEPSSGGGWFDRVEIGGVVEVEAAYSDSDTDGEAGDITVPTVELGIQAQINDWVGAEVVLLYEDEGDSSGDLGVDTAVISIADPNSIWYFVGGQYTLPFGLYETQMISDPLTLDLGETADAALEFGVETNGFYAAAYVFEGDQNDDADIDNIGVNLGYAMESGDLSLITNLGFINDLAESDLFVEDSIAASDSVAGYVISIVLTSGPFTLVGEYLSAAEEMEAYADEQPSAFNIEAGYGFEVAGLPANIAFGYQGTREAEVAAGGLAESRVLSTFGVEIFEGTSIALEIGQEQDYDGNKTNLVTGQVAVEF